MRISLNGREADAGAAKTVAELMGHLELPSETVLIEHNGVALHRREWPKRALADGDRIEIVQVAAGG